MLNASRTDVIPGKSGPSGAALMAVRALIVEDNGFDRRRITHAARDAGLNLDFTEASTCAQARELMEAESFGLCIFDYQLPDGDGVALTRERAGTQLNAQVPVIIIAGHGEAAVAVEAMHAGCADYLLKDTLTAEALKRSVINALEKSRLTQERDNAEAANDVLKTVLARFSKDCVTELRPTVTRMLRLIRHLKTESRDPHHALQLRELESAGTLLFGFLQEIEKYAAELPDQYRKGGHGHAIPVSRRLTEIEAV